MLTFSGHVTSVDKLVYNSNNALTQTSANRGNVSHNGGIYSTIDTYRTRQHAVSHQDLCCFPR